MKINKYPMRVKAGDVVLVDESLERDYYTRKYKAVVLWDSPFQQQPLLTDINEWCPHWGCHRHIAKIIGHIDLQQAIALLQEQEPVDPVLDYWRPDGGSHYKCGNCGCGIGYAYESRFCKQCGREVKWK